MRSRWMLQMLILLLVAVPATAQPPREDLRPQHPARRYVVRGTVKSVSATQLVVEGYDRHGGQLTRTLRVAESSLVPDGLKAGDRVVVDYNHTLENDVYEVVAVRRAGRNR